MKKVISLCLSLIMALSIVLGINMTAYAAGGSFTTAGTAMNYTVGTSVSGALTGNDGIDFIKFTLNESGRIYITAQGSDRYYIDLYSENQLSSDIAGKIIEYNSNLGKSYNEYSYSLVAGTYYLKAYYSTSKTINYTISTSFTSANESFYENLTVNDNIIGNANHIKRDTTYNGMLAENDKVDFYQFTATTGAHTIKIKSDRNVYFSVYTMNGSEIDYWTAYTNDSTSYAQKSVDISLSVGTYCLKIYHYPYGAYGDNYPFYSFSISSPHEHNYTFSKHVKATATSKGYDLYKCKCGASYKTNVTGYKKLSAPSIKSTKAISSGHKISVAWSKVSGAQGYQISWSKDSKGNKVAAKKSISNGATTKCTGKNFTKGRTYYVRVRAYKTTNGKKTYGKWSSAKKIKAK